MILITRPKNNVILPANKLDLLGHKTLILPLLKIKNLHSRIIDKKYQAVIITSQNSLRTINNNKWIKYKKIYVVGKTTMSFLKDLGCKKIIYTEKGAKHLTSIIINDIKGHANLLYLRGNEVAYDMGQALIKQKIFIDSKIVYLALARKYIRQQLLKTIKYSIDTILLYSPRSAIIFHYLVKKYNLNLANKRVICISEAVALKIQNLGWQEISVAKIPNEDSMFDALQ